jgi:hypothetical protein
MVRKPRQAAGRARPDAIAPAGRRAVDQCPRRPQGARTDGGISTSYQNTFFSKKPGFRKMRKFGSTPEIHVNHLKNISYYPLCPSRQESGLCQIVGVFVAEHDREFRPERRSPPARGRLRMAAARPQTAPFPFTLYPGCNSAGGRFRLRIAAERWRKCRKTLGEAVIAPATSRMTERLFTERAVGTAYMQSPPAYQCCGLRHRSRFANQH